MGVELKNVSFVVGQKGRERVLREKRKNVHAVVRGELINFESKSTDGLQRVTYNPYKNSSFVLAATGEPIYSSLSALIVGKQIYTK